MLLLLLSRIILLQVKHLCSNTKLEILYKPTLFAELAGVVSDEIHVRYLRSSEDFGTFR